MRIKKAKGLRPDERKPFYVSCDVTGVTPDSY